MDNFKVGQRIAYYSYSWGRLIAEVHSIYDNDTLCVKFPAGSEQFTFVWVHKKQCRVLKKKFKNG